MSKRVQIAIDMLDNQYRYETGNMDAAYGYCEITDEVARSTFGQRLIADTAEFTTSDPPDGAMVDGYTAYWIDGDTLYVYVNLGTYEMEAQLDFDLSDSEIEEVESTTDWVHVNGLWYTTYPDNLSVVATYTINQEND